MRNNDLTIREAVSLLRSGSLTASGLLRNVSEQLLRTEPEVHAFVCVAAEAAERDAKLADARLARGKPKGLLDGIPIAVKDVIDVQGLPTKAGSEVLDDRVASRDATVIQRLRECGALLVGKTTTHEFAFGFNALPTRNPWNPSYSPGGTSTGSAVAVASGSALGALGTDTGGSIRNPSAFSGVVGLKPTYGRVSRSGVVPYVPSMDHVGVIARTADDCGYLLEAIAGSDPHDRSTASIAVPHYVEMDGRDLSSLRGVRIGLERHYFFSESLDSVTSNIVEAALVDLAALGVQLIDIDIPELGLTYPVGLLVQLAEAADVHHTWFSRKPHQYDEFSRLMLVLGHLIPAHDYLRAQRTRSILQRAIRSAFNSYALDAMITPARSAPLNAAQKEPIQAIVDLYAGEEPTNLRWLVRNTFVANLTGQPAIVVPCGFLATGMPAAFQLIGRPFDEMTLLRVGRVYEESRKWYTHRPPLTTCEQVGTPIGQLPVDN